MLINSKNRQIIFKNLKCLLAAQERDHTCLVSWGESIAIDLVDYEFIKLLSKV